ncbi:MAG: hypothetical protein H6832_17710 [Planctomycetes bacterium]|nr:hypothetical protein [Planctomycetota bacterium]
MQLPPKTGALALVALLPLASLRAQNLVANASFETYSTCPTTSGQPYQAVGWIAPTTGTTDYMNACHTTGIVGVPNNAFGSQAANTGQAYMHIYTAAKNASNYREYVQRQLSSPLSAGVTYDVSFWVSKSDSELASAEIGAYFSLSPISLANSSAFNLVPQIENPSTNIITDTVNWVQVSGSFVASGGEQYITIGNFRTPANTTTLFVGGTHNGASYYVDDVSVVAQQKTCGSKLIGWADLASATVGFVDVQDFESNCQPAVTQCTTPVPVTATTYYAGGTAYNGRYRSVWVSDGVTLAEYETAATRQCQARCAPMPAILANRNASVSGLAFGDHRQVLFQLATVPGYFEITTYDASGRCLGQTTTCRGTLPTGALAAGLAYDELRDLLYVSIDVPGLAGFDHFLYVMLGSSPCTGICKSQLQSCTVRLTTGLAYDSCNQTLYATDGQVTQSYLVADPKRCDFRPATCCKKQNQPTWHGLAILPCGDNRSIGKPCTSSPCPSCPSMLAGSLGDAALGQSLPITLSNAPAPAFAILFLKVGPCGSGISLPPPFCGTFYPFPAIATFGPAALTSVSPCGGSAVQNIPIPGDARLCGLPFCAQWFVFCQAQNQFGFGFSNAIEFEVVGS